MFCPNCGQRQTSNDARFCNACGFALNAVSDLLASGGHVHWRPPEATHQAQPARPAALTPRQKGIRQGVMLMLSTFLLVPLLAIFGVALLHLPGEIVALAAVGCPVGGLLRLVYALMLESNVPAGPESAPAAAYVPPPSIPNYLGTPVRNASLPPPQSTPVPAPARPQRYNTGELVEPPRASVTDHTTRLLHKQPDEPPQS
ncbi:MAG: zinc ribbon domain-containing protein [Pyrinomonadaceae bacterium]